MGTQGTDPGTPALPDLRPLHKRATQRFVGYVKQIQPHQWTSPTPCSEWDVRALVDHVVRWNVFVPEFIAGRSVADIEAPFERDVLGKDPAASAAVSARAAVEAFASPGAMERIVHHPFGELPGAQVVYLRLFDNAIHGWDLARAIGADDKIDPDIVSTLHAGSLSQRELLRASGHFGPTEIAVPASADLQVHLLGLLGRSA